MNGEALIASVTASGLAFATGWRLALENGNDTLTAAFVAVSFAMVMAMLLSADHFRD